MKWAGGKRQLLPELKKYVPKKFNKYIEPFVGGGAMFFELNPRSAVLNDSNEELMNAYNVIKNSVNELINELETYLFSNELYYKLRQQNPTTLNPIKRAARFIFLNKGCFNGLYRVNRKGEFNVPIGSYINPQICDQNKLNAVSKRLQNVELISVDYKEALYKHAEKGDLIYIDPPYHPVSKYSDFKRYTKEFFGEKEQRELKEVIADLKKLGCFVISSNSYCDFILEIYREFEIHTVSANRNINAKVQKRGSLKEVIII